MRTTKAAVDRRAAAFTERQSVYEFLCQAYEGGTVYREANLFRHSPRETENDFNRRAAQAVYPNLVRPTLGIYRDHLYKRGEAVRRDIDDAGWQAFSTNCDLGGHDLNAFWSGVAIHELLFGWMGVLVDSPVLPQLDRPLTQADVNDGLTRPYFVAVCPMEIADWSLDEYGQLNWVHLLCAYTDNTDPMATPIETTLHRFYGRNEWWVYDGDGNLVSNGLNPLGRVPFVVVRFASSMRHPFIGTSFMEDYAGLNRAIMNSISLRHDFLAKNSLQILTLQLMPALADDGGGSEIVIRNLIEYAGEHAPQFVGPDVSGAQWMFQHVQDLVGWMRQMAMLQDVEVQVQAAESGVAKQVDFEQTNAALAAFADGLQNAEIEATKLWFAWQGREWSDAYVIDYPDTFNVRSLEADLASALAVREVYGDLSPTVVAESLGAVADRLLDHPDAALSEQIEDELTTNAGSLTAEAVDRGRMATESTSREPFEEPETVV